MRERESFERRSPKLAHNRVYVVEHITEGGVNVALATSDFFVGFPAQLCVIQ